MTGEPKEPISRVGQIPTIFLWPEVEITAPDLFSYSTSFNQKHTTGKLLSQGFGTISSLWRAEEDGEIKWRPDVKSEMQLPPHESIAFDSRIPDEFVWDLCYAEDGEQEVVRLIVSSSETQGLCARTNRQGGLVEILNMSQRQSFAIETYLIERLESPEVAAVIEGLYKRRRSTQRSLVKLINERSVDNRTFALDLGYPVDRIYPARDYDYRIKAHQWQLKNIGFPALMLFRAEWLERLNT